MSAKKGYVEREEPWVEKTNDWYASLANIIEIKWPVDREILLRKLHEEVDGFHKNQKKNCEAIEFSLDAPKKKREKVEKEIKRISKLVAKSKGTGLTRERNVAILLEKKGYLKKEIDDNTKHFNNLLLEIGELEDSLNICTHARRESGKVLDAIDKEIVVAIRQMSDLREVRYKKEEEKKLGLKLKKVPRNTRKGRQNIP